MNAWARVTTAACTALSLAALSACTTDAPPLTPTATGAAAEAALWWDDAVFYEVFVRSYADSDGDGTGDLRGLISRLDHLNDGDPTTTDDLGVTGLWLMPVTQSPSYHGYDTTDYFTVEDDYGTAADFRELVTQAHARGIRVIVDLVLNHTSSLHPWFLESASVTSSPKRDWYVWRTDNPAATTSWGTQAWHQLNGASYLGLFWEGMPDLNHRNPEVAAEVGEITRFWLEDMGVDGFRLDAVRHLIEEGDEFDDTPATHAWLARWDDSVDAVAPDALTVGEVWDATPVVAPYVTDDEVDLAFEFSLAEAIIASVRSGDPAPLDAALAATLAAFPPGQFATFLTNHDQNRVMSQLGGDVGKARLAASLLLTLPGVPFVYYGEEIGMTGEKPDERIRTPMQWSSEAHGGFSPTTPWQELAANWDEVNVAAQDADPASLLNHYRRLIHLRAEHPALRQGDLAALPGTCTGSYAYLRSATPPDAGVADVVLVAVNVTDRERSDCAFDASGHLGPGAWEARDLIAEPGGDGVAVTTTPDGSVALGTLGPRETVILALSPRS